eukprot:CAMPEP_0201556560 /NCGR_PEP_ID=MMETSP0173_2-20130828/56232_1 /ASSEMBLY_ACC=CAM_ASM_000268 /TAXON_ID=218659 /ORGANISM="Vexillifera sp., Strain DIVA3 564/2" /LENGTH=420 /DNA_ID=CAMNT_0047968893 /DNA_START=536 /DNA_END=1795 /DNA_ORIENTATION=-
MHDVAVFLDQYAPNASKLVDNFDTPLFSTDVDIPLPSSISDHQMRKNAQVNDLLLVHALIELSNHLSMFYQQNNATRVLNWAQHVLGLDIELTGILGKRTKFQQFQVAQLVAKAKRNKHFAALYYDQQQVSGAKEIALDDDTLLEKPSLVDDDQNQTKEILLPIEQSVVLSQCSRIQASIAKDPLTDEKVMSFVRYVQESPQNWLVHSQSLLMKSKLETGKMRTVQRSLLQIQSLVDQFHDDDPDLLERAKYYFVCQYPLRVLLKREHARFMMGMGVAASALQIFRELEMWEDAIKCLIIMRREQQAETMVRDRIAERPSAELWLLLGDITGKDEYFVRAWEFSNNTYSKAQRYLGRSLLKKGQFAKAKEAFESALVLNPLFPDVWFSLGCCAMQLEQWESAQRAFTRMVSLDPSNGEAW